MDDHIRWALRRGQVERALRLAGQPGSTFSVRSLEDKLINKLLAEGSFPRAAALLPQMLALDLDRWVQVATKFENYEALSDFAAVVPLREPQLPGVVYEGVLLELEAGLFGDVLDGQAGAVDLDVDVALSRLAAQHLEGVALEGEAQLVPFRQQEAAAEAIRRVLVHLARAHALVRRGWRLRGKLDHHALPPVRQRRGSGGLGRRDVAREHLELAIGRHLPAELGLVRQAGLEGRSLVVGQLAIDVGHDEELVS